MSTQNITEQLKRFSPKIADFGESINAELIRFFEEAYNVELPKDYKELLYIFNGFSVMGNEVYGIGENAVTLPLENAYQFEHFQVEVPQPLHLVPFSSDGGGNFYCFDTQEQTANGQSCAIVFWVSNYLYTTEDAPAQVYETFEDFVQEVIIDWTLEDYDYEGNTKQ
jgi:hypothetical protein